MSFALSLSSVRLMVVTRYNIYGATNVKAAFSDVRRFLRYVLCECVNSSF